MMKSPFCGLTFEMLSRKFEERGYDQKSALRTATNFYRRRIPDFSQMNNISRDVRHFLDAGFTSGIYAPVRSEESADHSVKYLFTEGEKTFETVYLPDKKRKTLCVSTQSGCRMGCPFCLTGRYGFRANLTAGDIINQVISVPQSREITHVVFMGMGEPLDNLDAVLAACSILTSSWGLALSPANITVSTVGITPGVVRFLNESDCNLTLSLYSPFPAEREEMVPAEKKYPVKDILNLIKEYKTAKKRRLSIAYLMIRGKNDSDSHLGELISLLRGSRIRINLLNYHPVKGEPLVSSTVERMQFFKHELISAGISASVRKSRGEDISAACGLLAANKYIQ